MTFLDLSIIIFSFIIISLLTGWMLYYLLRRNQPPSHDPVLSQWLQSMHQSLEKTNAQLYGALNQNNKNITDTLQQSSQIMNKRLDTATSIVADVSRELGKMNELGKSMRDLQMMLKAPKLRGNYGEEILADMLAQILPKSNFHLQYTLRGSEKVDAVIQTSNGLLPIDAKFPMESFVKKMEAETEVEKKRLEKVFEQDIKKHIKSISQKYIVPEAGTVDFALMYVPSESVYYDMIQTTNTSEFARQQRVYPVSPNTLYAHLQTLLLALEGQKLEEKSKQVMKVLRMLQKDYARMEENFETLGKHLGNASNQYVNVSQQFGQIGQKLQQPLLEEGNA